MGTTSKLTSATANEIMIPDPIVASQLQVGPAEPVATIGSATVIWLSNVLVCDVFVFRLRILVLSFLTARRLTANFDTGERSGTGQYYGTSEQQVRSPPNRIKRWTQWFIFRVSSELIAKKVNPLLCFMVQFGFTRVHHWCNWWTHGFTFGFTF